MAKPRILLTGAAGKVGRLLRPGLRAAYTLRLCDRAPITDLAPGEEFLAGDLADPAVARAAVADVTGVVHLAALVAADVSFEETLGPNYRALLALLEACRAAGVPRFVFASTHHVHGLLPLAPTPLTAPPAPDGFYALSKVFGEGACALYAHRYGLATLIIRIGNVGPDIADTRRERLWVSARDLVQLVTLGLEHPGLVCATVSGTSDCPDPIFAPDAAAAMGYRPQDRAADHHAPGFHIAQPPAGALIGGTFATAPLPDPGRRERG